MFAGGHHHDHPNEADGVHNTSNETSEVRRNNNSTMEVQTAIPACVCHETDPGQELDEIRNMAVELENHPEHRCAAAAAATAEEEGADDATDEEQKTDGVEHDQRAHDAKLMRMSINTALAIGLHNFPEGLATFVATLSDPKVGGVLAMAIAIHNIPEGLCVAMPIYYATGDRWKAFGWGVLSGLAEPIAALFGWLVLANVMSDKIYAILFGLVAGMMVIISARELLPTAHRYDPTDTVVTYSFMVGMAIMALSLILFLL